MIVDDKWIERVISNLTQRSVEKKIFSKARQEWIYAGLEDNEVCDMDCELCDHEDIRYEYRIHNKHNSNEMVVGSTCIKKFLDYLSKNSETMKDGTGDIVNKARVDNDKKLYWIKLTNQYLNENFYTGDFQKSITDKVELDGKLTIKQAIYLKNVYGKLDEMGKKAMRETIKIRLNKKYINQYYDLKPLEKEFIYVLLSLPQKNKLNIEN